MAYTRINWQDGPSGGTPLSAANLNHMEQGIADAHADLDAATASPIANELIRRDANGRASVAPPTSASHIATKGYVDEKVRFRVIRTNTFTINVNLASGAHGSFYIETEPFGGVDLPGLFVIVTPLITNNVSPERGLLVSGIWAFAGYMVNIYNAGPTNVDQPVTFTAMLCQIDTDF